MVATAPPSRLDVLKDIVTGSLEEALGDARGRSRQQNVLSLAKDDVPLLLAFARALASAATSYPCALRGHYRDFAVLAQQRRAADNLTPPRVRGRNRRDTPQTFRARRLSDFTQRVLRFLKWLQGSPLRAGTADVYLHWTLEAGQKGVVKFWISVDEDTETLKEIVEVRELLAGDSFAEHPESGITQKLPMAIHQFPRPIDDFVGRSNERATAAQALRTGGIVVIHGPGGMGKTKLAEVIANELADEFDIHIWRDAYGSRDRATSTEELLRKTLAELGVATSIEDVEHLQRAFRSYLFRKHALVVVDDARDADQVRALSPPRGSAMLVTSQQPITVDGSTVIALKEFEPDEAKALLLEADARCAEKISPSVLRAVEETAGREVHLPVTAASTDVPERLQSPEVIRSLSAGPVAEQLSPPPDSASLIAYLCGYIPAAVRAAANVLRDRLTQPSEFAIRLADRRRRLEPVAASLTITYERLTEAERGAFRKLAVFMYPFTARGAQYVCELGDDATLAELKRVGLITHDETADVYRMNDVIQVFADSLLEHDERRTAEYRYAEVYATVAQQLKHALRDPTIDTNKALRQLLLRWDHIKAGQNWCVSRLEASEETDRVCATYGAAVDALFGFAPGRNRALALAWGEAGLAAAQRLKDNDLVAANCLTIATTACALHDFARSLTACQLGMSSAPSDADTYWRLLRTAHETAAVLGFAQENVRYVSEMLQLTVEEFGPCEVAVAYHLMLAELHLHLHQYRTARSHAATALRWADDLRLPRFDTYGWAAHAWIQLARGTYTAADISFRRALQQYRAMSDDERWSTGLVLTFEAQRAWYAFPEHHLWIGRAFAAVGRGKKKLADRFMAKAEKAMDRAEPIVERWSEVADATADLSGGVALWIESDHLYDHSKEATRRRDAEADLRIGQLHSELGNSDSAVEWLTSAIAIPTSAVPGYDRRVLALALLARGATFANLKRPRKAREDLAAAADLLQLMGLPAVDEAHHLLSSLRGRSPNPRPATHERGATTAKKRDGKRRPAER